MARVWVIAALATLLMQNAFASPKMCADTLAIRFSVPEVLVVDHGLDGPPIYRLFPYKSVKINDRTQAEQKSASNILTICDNEQCTLRQFKKSIPSNFAIVQASYVHGVPVPGFDGFILDEYGEPILNLSIKRVANVSDVSTAFKWAQEKIDEFSKSQDIWTQKGFRDGYWVQKVFSMFGLGRKENRRSVVVLEIVQDTSLKDLTSILNELRSALTNQKNGHIESVTVINRGSFHRVYASGIRPRI